MALEVWKSQPFWLLCVTLFCFVCLWGRLCSEFLSVACVVMQWDDWCFFSPQWPCNLLELATQTSLHPTSVELLVLNLKIRHSLSCTFCSSWRHLHESRRKVNGPPHCQNCRHSSPSSASAPSLVDCLSQISPKWPIVTFGKCFYYSGNIFTTLSQEAMFRGIS